MLVGGLVFLFDIKGEIICGNHVGCLDGDIFKKRPFPTIASIIAVIFLRQLNFYYICSVKCENKA